MRLLPGTGSNLRTATERSVTLLRVFLLASAVIIAAGGVLLSSILTRAVSDQAVADSRSSVSQYVDGVLRGTLVRGGQVRVSRNASVRLTEELRRNRALVTVKVWRPDGVLAWTNRAQARIGRRFDIDGDLGEAISSREAAGHIDQLSGDEDAVEERLGFDHLLEVYAPILSANGRKVLGVYEIYADPKGLEQTLASRRNLIWATVAGVLLALWVALALLVRGASTTLTRQTRELRVRSKELLASYQRLEESSLEAIASLNATVEAKDPDTAGHSLRVQQVALAIAAQLELTAQQVDALRFGSLFHDIGKIAVPDGILVKPAKLDDWEYAQMQTHSAEGARIVGKFGRLREAVPIIRHHHEWWDGSGYPDGLAGDAIPLEAAIVGLADAWDAMTTDRPYHRALTGEEALAEVHAGRGTQFSPVVVDAFFFAAALLPDQLGLDEPLQRAV
ncbi:MAG TPA: HD domain-containing phosphohydrolase [Gaiellaceae bacterium]|nr:HD domain-containing phosphohydrolase [Gaiellaceae bacterium]